MLDYNNGWHNERRVMEMENGNRVIFTVGPRYPFWKVHFEKGGTPEKLKGQWQYFEEAVYAVNNYLENRPSRNRTTLKTEIE